MVGFGILGFVLRELKFPMAPLVLGIVLGELLDANLRRGLALTNGDPTPFFTRPISLVLCVITVATIALSVPAIGRRMRGALKFGRQSNSQ
jgi:putative tricarboxylic transport membrane protein